ncbi:hypothetical protein AVEN_74646-1 [Araneus ventricosus]|uniref:Uncharacterized protein n=1 Tax=Araneus ventricosus TaxID=182803 RepID=A0A4Y2EZD4_ARAVE|nr:hypothetical protein AVEN_74646-1 [Araneus ventricosus]
MTSTFITILRIRGRHLSHRCRLSNLSHHSNWKVCNFDRFMRTRPTNAVDLDEIGFGIYNPQPPYPSPSVGVEGIKCSQERWKSILE